MLGLVLMCTILSLYGYDYVLGSCTVVMNVLIDSNHSIARDKDK